MTTGHYGSSPTISLPGTRTIYNEGTFFSTWNNPATYADSTTTYPRPTVIGIGLRMYILAQFSEHTSFDWVQRVRGKIGKDEIKHADVIWARAAWPGNKDLWRSIDRGIQAATIYVVDPGTYVQHVFSEALGEWRGIWI